MNMFRTKNIWRHLREKAAASAHPSFVAVAYYGQTGPKLLPLAKGSRLVVDASEGSVSSGRTCPKALLAAVKKGVKVFSISNLHAKVFVFDSRVFVGSANASEHSASTLVEAVMESTDRQAIADAKMFIKTLCRNPLGPEELNRLQALYKPPKYFGDGGRRKTPNNKINEAKIPPVYVAKLYRENAPTGSEKSEVEGLKTAKCSKEHRNAYDIQAFWWTGKCEFKAGDIVVQVTEEKDGKKMISPPGKVLHTREWRGHQNSCTFVYLEVPSRRRISLESLVNKGYISAAQMNRGGARSLSFSKKMLAFWNR